MDLVPTPLFDWLPIVLIVADAETVDDSDSVTLDERVTDAVSDCDTDAVSDCDADGLRDSDIDAADDCDTVPLFERLFVPKEAEEAEEVERERLSESDSESDVELVGVCERTKAQNNSCANSNCTMAQWRSAILKRSRDNLFSILKLLCQLLLF